MVVDKQLRELQLASKLGLQYSVAIERGRRPSGDLKDRHHEQPRIGGVLTKDHISTDRHCARHDGSA